MPGAHLEVPPLFGPSIGDEKIPAVLQFRYPHLIKIYQPNLSVFLHAFLKKSQYGVSLEMGLLDSTVLITVHLLSSRISLSNRVLMALEWSHQGLVTMMHD